MYLSEQIFFNKKKIYYFLHVIYKLIYFIKNYDFILITNEELSYAYR